MFGSRDSSHVTDQYSPNHHGQSPDHAPISGDFPPSAVEQRLLAVLAERLGAASVGTATWDAEAEYERLATRIANEQSHPADSPSASTRVVSSRPRAGQHSVRWWKTPTRTGWRVYALTAIVCVVALGGILRNVTTSSFNRATTYATSAGQVTNVTLSDGTHIRLASRSSVTIPRDFGAHSRTVVLTGEAYFDVAAHTTPFMVQAGHVTAHVLGTTFDVRHYTNDPDVRVVVVDGKVTLRAPGARPLLATLVAGNVAHVRGDSLVSFAETTSPQDSVIWTSGQMIFKGVTVPEMLRTVGEWYGYDFRLADSSLVHERVNAVFELRSSDVALRAIQSMLDVSMKYEGKVILLRAQKDDHRRSTPVFDGGHIPITKNPSEVGR